MTPAVPISVQARPFRPAKIDRTGDNGLQHGVQVECGPADDLQHIAGRGLVFERLLEIAGALAQLVEQPRILDRDHRLVGEGAPPVRLAVPSNGSTRRRARPMTPMSAPSRSSGTPSIVWTPPPAHHPSPRKVDRSRHRGPAPCDLASLRAPTSVPVPGWIVAARSRRSYSGSMAVPARPEMRHPGAGR